MNPVAPLLRLLRPAAAPGRASPAAPMRMRPVRGVARPTLLWFAATVLLLHVAAYLAMDVIWPELRDPEYGRRVIALKARMAEHPTRPLVVVVGSSRCSMGVRPDVWEEARPNAAAPDPLLFNLSLLGSGPVMEQFCLRRLYADGVKPDAVVLEYWPAFMRQDGTYFEPDRMDPRRLYTSDLGFVREFDPNAAKVERIVRDTRRNPVFENRQRWLCFAVPSWLPWTRRVDIGWNGLDGWGWLPGLENDDRARPFRLAHCEAIYRTQFYLHSIHPVADKAMRDSVALARANGAKVSFVYMPEATEFRTWVPPEVERAGREYIESLCRELDVPLIDARFWIEDKLLVDGFHLSREGAAVFTRRFGPAVASTFPNLKRRP